MKDTSAFSKIFLGIDKVDFRKQARGLIEVAKAQLGENVFDEKVLFVFVNRRRDGVKLVYWDQTGFAMWWKTLEKDKFSWPKKVNENKLKISVRELKWLLAGIDFSRIKMHEKLNFMQTS